MGKERNNDDDPTVVPATTTDDDSNNITEIEIKDEGSSNNKKIQGTKSCGGSRGNNKYYLQ